LRSASAVTIRDIAFEAAVSVGTASNVLSGRTSVKADLRDRVLKAAERLSYRRNLVAANLRRRDSRTIGLCIPALNNPFFCDLMQRIVSLAEEDGYDVLVLETREDGRDERKKLETLYSNRVRGVFMVPTGSWSGERDPGVPMVVVDRIRPGEALPSVALDNVAASAKAVETLVELGHRSIWMVANSRRIWNTNLRAEGFLAAAKRMRIKDAEVLEVGMTPRQTAQAVRDALGGGRRPTAIVTASAIATLGTLRAIQDEDLSVPDDISLLGFDDVPWMDVLRPSISVVSQPIDEIGRRAWKLMQSAFKGKVPPEHVFLEAEIIHRESTKRVE
jgi:LacI family transcriptional regulator